MKKTILTLVTLALIGLSTTNAQVGIGTTTPDASAQLEVQSTTKGFLPPRMTAAERNTISNPAQGLMIYCTNCGSNGEAQLFNGTDWTNMSGDAATDAPSNIYWVEKANDGTNIEFIVRTDLDGNNKVTLVTSEGFAVQNFGSNMQLTDTNIYWVEKANDGTNDEFIVRTDLDGNNKVSLVTSEGFAVQNFGSNM